MYVCLPIVCLCMFVYVHLFMCLCVSMSVPVSLCVCVTPHVFVCQCLRLSVCVVCLYMSVYDYVCVYIWSNMLYLEIFINICGIFKILIWLPFLGRGATSINRSVCPAGWLSV